MKNDAKTQRAIVLAWLLLRPLSTLEARKDLDIMAPAARIFELKQQGHNIVTHWTIADNGKARHRIASYVLLAQVGDV
ncbi:helix-turn-helix domain-containing protein [Methylobacter sp. S3L5C]|uniref:helix-turn-helix domain-containing protein n=1 Tax=Methylobacter sp. S3L5C TaxID=2839024 RepID=UPI001FAC5D3D|nr:helix-turn-helix domain-containing protein [Methylobacter sp. S3L5C]UOA06944.1 helix-turn-helix domain-containing protein [Methylobacter sp. S3L5C]